VILVQYKWVLSYSDNINLFFFMKTVCDTAWDTVNACFIFMKLVV